MDDRRSICIVANELKYLFRNGGIGTHNWLLAESLADAGWDVHVLYCADVEDPSVFNRIRASWKPKGISLRHLDEFSSPQYDQVRCLLVGDLDRHSMRIRRALEQLDARHHFDLIEFAEWAGHGFRSIQAHKMGLSFSDARIIVRLHSSNQWCRDANRLWMGGLNDLHVDFYERYCFENADYQLSPSRYMLEYARSVGWNVRNDAQVIPYCYPTPSSKPNLRNDSPTEVVFFGRLEQRKGLKLFLETAKQLPAEIAVSFLGKDLCLDGVPASKLISDYLGDRSHTIHSSFDSDEALAYLGRGNRVAVMPSLVENYPFTVLECAVNAIPVLASNVGGIPEIISDAELQQAILFEPNVNSLRTRIEEYFSVPATTRSHWATKLREKCAVVRNNQQVCAQYHQLATSLPVQKHVTEPLVTLVVPYFNMGDYLPETLESLANQDYPCIEVIIVNDGSTDEHSLQVLEQMRTKYPQFQFVTQPNQGLSGARNQGLQLARGKYFIPVDADNIARPHMVSSFVRAMERNPDVSAITCYLLAFEQSTDIAAGNFRFAYRPSGGPYVAASFLNVYGDANAITKTSALRSVGGYEIDRDTTCEDWELYVKLARCGHKLDVLPEHLFYYRYRPAGLLRTTDPVLNRRRVLRQFFPDGRIPRAEQIQLWTMMASIGDLWHKQLLNNDTAEHIANHMYQKMMSETKERKSTAQRVAKEVGRAMRRLKRPRREAQPQAT